MGVVPGRSAPRKAPTKVVRSAAKCAVSLVLATEQ